MQKFLISDCDYTLVDFNHEGGIEAVRESDEFSYLADPLNDYFQSILDGMRTGGDKKFAGLKLALEQLSNEIVAGEDKLDEAVWSRELWAYHFLTDTPNTERVKKSQQAANIYWRGVGQTSSIYKDTPPFIESLERNNFSVVLVTSSDARLTFDEENNQFIYIPAEAKRMKIERYHECGLGVMFDLEKNLHIGDPISKPNQIFWEETLREVAIEPSSENNIVVIGDSYDTDLKGSEWFKTKAILLDRDRKHTGVAALPAADHVAHDLEEALNFIL